MSFPLGAFDRTLGSALVIPGSLFGFAGLADAIGPQGWRGLSEFFGWFAICLAASLFAARLLSRMRRPAGQRYLAAASLIMTVALFTILPDCIGLSAPMAVKVVFTTTLQAVGNLAVAAAIGWIGYCLWTENRSR